MSTPGKPAWPAPGAFPFLSFPMPGMQAPAAPPSSLDAGMDLLKNFWGALPGSTQVPGFLVPTVDLDELDKRLADLRAAESWVEVNLNMLRSTIQGLEVQRHTIAALKSLAVVSDAAMGAPFAAPAAAASGASSDASPPDVSTDAAAVPPVASQWLGYLQEQFAKVAQAALAAAPPAPAATKSAGRTRKVARKRAARAA